LVSPARIPTHPVSYGIAPSTLSTKVATVSKVRKTRSQCATLFADSCPAAASPAHPVPIPSYVTLPVSGTAQDAPVPHLVDPRRLYPITPLAPQVTIPADTGIGRPVDAAPEILTQTSPVGGPLIELFQMVSSLMTEVSELRGMVTAIEVE
jgi:hypothetical protein